MDADHDEADGGDQAVAASEPPPPPQPHHEWSLPEPEPRLPTGWAVRTRRRAPNARTETDFIAPDGAHFSTIKQALDAAAASDASGAGAKRKPASKKKTSPSKRARKHELLVCAVCGSPDQPAGNDLVVCHGRKPKGRPCALAYHIRCLPVPLAAAPEGEWLCPGCDPVRPLEVFVPAPYKRDSLNDRSVDGVDLGAWASKISAREARPRALAPLRLSLGSLAGAACLVDEAAGAPPRAGLIVDARSGIDGEVAVAIQLVGRTAIKWIALGSSSSPRVYVGCELCRAPRKGSSSVLWPARLFRRIGLSTFADASSKGAVSSEMTWVKFFGASDAPLAALKLGSTHELPLTVATHLTGESEADLATLEAIEWAASNPRHNRSAPPLELPPSDVMEALIGQAIEVLWIAEAKLYRARVQSYDAATGRHFLLYSDGDLEWLSLSRGHYGWQQLGAEAGEALRAQLAEQASAGGRHSLPGEPIGMTVDGSRILGPPDACVYCEVPQSAPGGLVECERCRERFHANCLARVQSASEPARCVDCSRCDACGSLTPNELVGAWSSDELGELAAEWRADASRRVLCTPCHLSLQLGGLCAARLRTWAGGERGVHCRACDMWSSRAELPATLAAEGPAGVPMPLPPPASAGGPSGAAALGRLAPKAQVPQCGRCAQEAVYWSLRDAYEELASLDPLRYFAEPVDEETFPDYRTVIPDPMDFRTMRERIEGGKCTSPADLADDLAKLCRNAVVYNTTHNNPYRRAAKALHTRGSAILRAYFGNRVVDGGDGGLAGDGDDDDAETMVTEPIQSSPNKKEESGSAPAALPDNPLGGGASVAEESLLGGPSNTAISEVVPASEAVSTKSVCDEALGSSAPGSSAPDQVAEAAAVVATGTCEHRAPRAPRFSIFDGDDAVYGEEPKSEKLGSGLDEMASCRVEERALLSQLPSMCVQCCSGGEELYPMLHCSCCGASYHRFCSGIPEGVDVDEALWRCPDCNACRACGEAHDEDQLLLCDCGAAYHTYCLKPKLTSVPTGRWRCPNCVRCERCGTTKPGKGGWRCDHRFCFECGKLHEQQGYCRLCLQDCREYEGAMVCCEKCDFWVHIECDGISQRGFDYLASRGEDYVCPHCAGREQLAYGKSLEAKIVAKLEAKAAAQQAARLQRQQAALAAGTSSAAIPGEQAPAGSLEHPAFASSTLPHAEAASADPSLQAHTARPLEFSVVAHRATTSSAGASPSAAAWVPLSVSVRDAIRKPEPTAPIVASSLACSRPAPVEKGPSACSPVRLGAVAMEPSDRCTSETARGEAALPIAVPKDSSHAAPIFVAAVPSPSPTLSVAVPNQSQVPLNAAAPTATPMCAEVLPSECTPPSKSPTVGEATEEALPPLAPPSVDVAAPAAASETAAPDAAQPLAVSACTAASVPSRVLPSTVICEFCGLGDACRTNDRMLFVPPGQSGAYSWAHASCCVWASEVAESPSGELVNLGRALLRSRKTACAHCGGFGASVGCNIANCKSVYHLACCEAAGAAMLRDGAVYCSKHRASKKAEKDLAKVGAYHVQAGDLRRPLHPPQLRTGGFRVHACSPGEWLRVGALVVLRSGSTPEGTGEPPVGFVAWRRHWSAVTPGAKCGYALSISAGAGEGAARRFRIIAEDDAMRPIDTSTAADAVAELYDRLRAVRGGADDRVLRFPFAAAYFFGWLYEPVQLALHGQTALDAARATQQQARASADASSANASGCARGAPVLWKEAVVPAVSDLRERAPRQERRTRGADEETATSTQQLLGNVEKLKGLNDMARTRLKVKRSNIHGWGLFVKEPVLKGEMLIEYQGLLVRSSANQSLLRRYTRDNVFGATDGSYIFRIDEETQVDATLAGNMARFGNHSCSPNCVSKILDMSAKASNTRTSSLMKHIVLYAARDLEAGEELQYDYQFALGGEKIICRCGAPNCWGRMN